jgi:DNA (cytosine-5)-methyltransferase 3A
MIKLLIGGSPCTYWSIAQTNGRETEAKGMGWELFKNYLIAKEKFKPDFFLYENNKSAAKPIKDQISRELGVDLMYINSALVSAQNRQRFYAFNWEVDQPEDRGIVLKDILESSDPELINTTDDGEKARTLMAGYYKYGTATLITNEGFKGGTPAIAEPLCVCHTIPQEVRVRKYTCDIGEFQALLRESKAKTKLTNKQIATKMNRPQTEVEHWFRTDKCFNIPDENLWFTLKELLNIQTDEFDDFVTVFEIRDGVFEKSERCYDVEGKMSTLMTGKTDNIIAPANDKKQKNIYEVKNGFIIIKDKQYPIKLKDGWYIIRKLTPKECERLQTLPDDYTKAVSDSHRYKGLGNGWTAEVIIHILNGVLKDVPRDEEIVVLSMYDGIGTGRYCLDKMGFTNVKYFAYEIDKFAIQVAMSNYPDIIQCGDAFDLRHPDWTIGY